MKIFYVKIINRSDVDCENSFVQTMFYRSKKMCKRSVSWCIGLFYLDIMSYDFQDLEDAESRTILTAGVKKLRVV